MAYAIVHGYIYPSLLNQCQRYRWGDLKGLIWKANKIIWHVVVWKVKIYLSKSWNDLHCSSHSQIKKKKNHYQPFNGDLLMVIYKKQLRELETPNKIMYLKYTVAVLKYICAHSCACTYACICRR